MALNISVERNVCVASHQHSNRSGMCCKFERALNCIGDRGTRARSATYVRPANEQVNAAISQEYISMNTLYRVGLNGQPC